MSRYFYLLSVTALAVCGQGDPAFGRVPFDEWLKGGPEGHLKWSAGALMPLLSVHQRLIAGVSARIDGSEFVGRKPGQLVVFVEIRDGDNRTWRTHGVMNFEELKRPGDLASAALDLYAFIRPGQYQAAVAVYDRESKEHVLKRLKLRVPELSRDPLPELWSSLPAVEFVDLSQERPDRWFLPEAMGRLHLPVTPAGPLRVDVVVNESPTENSLARAGRTARRNMGNLIPALKVLSQMDISKGSVSVALLDLERRKVSFTQDDAAKLDWPGLKAALQDNDPNTIDVKALEHHEQNAQFFISEIRKRVEANPAGALIVLSGPMAFAKGQDLTPIPAVPGAKVFYIRYYPPSPGPLLDVAPRRGRGIAPPPPMLGRGALLQDDSLAATLKPLSPKRFDVSTAAEFRSALASIVSELSRTK
jgi:hypothetical protein